MKLDGRRESGNVEDRRGSRPAAGRAAVGGAIGGGGAVLALILVFGGDPAKLLGDLFSGGSSPAGLHGAANPGDDALAKMSSQVLASTEDAWNQLFHSTGKTCKAPKLVLFTGSTEAACGGADAAAGPFYCSSDGQIYLDLSFFSELAAQYGVPGDFAQAYVIAHEVGHRVQDLLGTLDREVAKERSLPKAEANALSVRLELQADFSAGVWAHYFAETEGGKHLEAGDIEEALGAASSIGDDRLQMEARGYAVPETFTHGTAAQRAKWFCLGYEIGDPAAGDTFFARDL